MFTRLEKKKGKKKIAVKDENDENDENDDNNNIDTPTATTTTTSDAPPTTTTVPTTTANSENEESKFDELTLVTLQADRYATTHLGAILFPLIVGFSIYTLIMNKHSSWYSWGITTLTSSV